MNLRPRIARASVVGLGVALAAFGIGACSGGGGGSLVTVSDGGSVFDNPAPSKDAGRDGQTSDSGSHDAGTKPHDGGTAKDASTVTKPCTQLPATCPNQASIVLCEVDDTSGACLSRSYTVGGQQSFECASCTDCSDAYTEAVDSCTPTVVDAGSTESCTAVTGCNGSLQFCQTTNQNTGTCVSARYVTSASSFACTSCSNCTSAYNSALNSCTPTTSSGGCASLTQCCNSLSSSLSSTCLSSVSYYQTNYAQATADAYCGSVLSSYQSSNYCLGISP